jgi:hypothetical protein
MEITEHMPNKDEQAHPHLPSPSTAYQQAFGSPVYRLSELMFGSLLAAYVLGFIGFAAAFSTPGLSSPSGEVIFLTHLALFRAPFCFISIAFAYVTAGFYVSYHAGILTMHHMPLENLRFDFALALSQALLFGISMLHPLLFPAVLGVTLILAVLRQRQEFRALVDSLDIGLHPPPAGVDPRNRKAHHRESFLKTRTKLRTLLGENRFSLLSVWKEVPKKLLVYAAILIALSISSKILVNRGVERTYVLCAVSLLICVVVVASVHRTLGKRASLLYNKMAEMDDQYEKLLKEL